MKINAAFTKRPKIKAAEHFQSDFKRRTLILSVLSIALGITFGTIMFIFNDKYISNELLKFFIDFETDFSGKSFFEIFFGFLAVNLVYIILLVVFGSSAIGEIPIVLLTFIKSLGIGSLTSYLFGEYGIRGLEYYLLVFLPGKVVLIFAMVLLLQNSLLSSHQIRQTVKGIINDKIDIKLYLLRTALIILIFILASIVDASAIKLFSPLFSFNT